MAQPTIIADRYQIDETIGDGAMGTIYKGVDLDTNEVVAIKALKLDVVKREPTIIARFEREGEALRQLNHPNIVKILATVQDGENYYLIMEYVSGGTLDDLLERVPQLTIKQVLQIGLGIADALTRTHELGIIHRDIKPGNILLDKKGVPRLTDFGVARVADSRMTQTGMVMGTLEYLSPEAFEYFELDTRTDIWAFGVTLFEALTGQFPFHGESFPETMYEVMTQPVPDIEQLRPDTPVGLIDLIYRMLEKNRESRIPSVRMIGAELEAIQRGLPITSRSLRGSFKKITSKFEVTLRFDAPISSARQHHNLPTPTTPFVGREHELETLMPHLVDESVRCIVLVGSEGIGTSRIALEAAHRQLDNFVDGVYMLPLAPIHDEGLILPSLAEAIGYTIVNTRGETRGLLQQLVDYLRSKVMLLVLDQLDHLLEGNVLVSLIETLQHHTQGVKVLATAKTIPNIGAHLTIKEMPYQTWVTRAEAKQAALPQILLQSAAQIQPDWEINSENLRYLYKMCRLVAGTPLALEIAGGWVDQIDLKEIAARISHEKKSLPPELEDSELAIQSALRYAWHLLDPRMQTILAQLSVFSGGFLRDAAQTVTEASLQQLMALVNRSLVTRDQTGRYGFHPTIQAFVSDRLNEDRTLASNSYTNHCAYYASYVWTRGAGLKSDGQLKSLRDIEVELHNIRSAWSYAVASAAYAEIIKMAEPLGIFFELLYREQEGVLLFERAASHIQKHPLRNKHRALSTVLIQYGRLLVRTGKLQAAQDVLEQSRVMVNDMERTPELEAIYLYLGDAAIGQGLTEKAVAHYENGLKYAEGVSNYHITIQLLNRMTDVAMQGGNWDTFEKMNQTGLALASKIGDKFGMMSTLNMRAEWALLTGDYETADSDLQNVLEFYRDTGNALRIIGALLNLGRSSFWQGAFSTAEDYVDEAWTLSREIGDRFGLGRALVLKGMIANTSESYVAAIDAFAEGQSHISVTGDSWGMMLSQAGLAHALRAIGETSRAAQYGVQALTLAYDADYTRLMVHLLVEFAAIYAHQGNVERGTELLALSISHPSRATWLTEDRTIKALRRTLRAALSENRFEACVTHGKALRLDPVVEDILGDFTVDDALT